MASKLDNRRQRFLEAFLRLDEDERLPGMTDGEMAILMDAAVSFSRSLLLAQALGRNAEARRASQGS